MPRALFYLESTGVPADRSVAEISAELVKTGARKISTEYSDTGRISGMNWALRIGAIDVQFSMPARVDSVYKLLVKRAKTTDKLKLTAKAERIAWRQLLMWIKAQNAMIQTGMVQPQEVFMAYAVAPGQNRTMFQIWSSQLQLPAPQEKTEK